MKKIIILFLTIILLCGCANEITTDGKNNKKNYNKNNEYFSFLKDFKNNIEEEKDYQFALLDIDNDAVDELLLLYKGTDLSVYKYNYNKDVVKIGHHDFMTGTIVFYDSLNKSDYPGVFCFSADGGYEWYRYIFLKNDQLIIEDLWNEDYSGISEMLGEKRERIKEISLNKSLIQESRMACKDNQKIIFKDFIE